MIEYRWLTTDEIEYYVNPVCASRAWMQLNLSEEPPTCRVLGAFDSEYPDLGVIAFFALQLTPVLGPAWADPLYRNGVVMRDLADRMDAFMVEANARGAVTICDSPVSERLCQRHGMERITEPVYQWIGARS